MEKNALIIGASGGIGQALTHALTARGYACTTLSRSRDGFDLTDEARCSEVLTGLPGGYDRVFVASGALEINGATPEKTIRHLSAQALMDQFAVNAVGPALILKQAHHLLPRDRASVLAVLSARVGSIGDNRLGGWISYRAAKAAVNQIVHTTAIELARTHKQAVCVSLHPGTVQTEFTRKYVGRHPAVPAEEAAGNLLRVTDGLTSGQTGQFFVWAGDPVPW